MVIGLMDLYRLLPDVKGENLIMNLSNVVQYLPAIATALVNPVAGISELAAQFLGPKIGIDSPTVSAVTEKLSGMAPDEIFKLRELDVQFQQHLSDNGIKLA